tara:strand:+ start:213 stop:557 length:345 start_codon:yes stop_codon:yes gene_type:complete
MTRTIKKRGYVKPTYQEEQEIWRKKRFVIGIFRDTHMLVQIGNSYQDYETAHLAVQYLESVGIRKHLRDSDYIACDFETLKPSNIPVISVPVLSWKTPSKIRKQYYGKENRYIN